MSGFVTSTLTSPLWVVKTRLQLDNRYVPIPYFLVYESDWCIRSPYFWKLKVEISHICGVKLEFKIFIILLYQSSMQKKWYPLSDTLQKDLR